MKYTTESDEVEVKIFTSYHAKMRKLTAEEIVPVNISRYDAKWFPEDLVTDRRLAPTSDMFQMDEATYTTKFAMILMKCDIRSILADILAQAKAYAEERNWKKRNHLAIALNCYEKPDEFCHRHQVAKWITEQMGEQVMEFDESKHSIPKPEQQKLF